MPIDYRIMQSPKLVLARGQGVVTGSEVVEHLKIVAKDPLYTAPMKKLTDYRQIDQLVISSTEAWRIAELKKSLQQVFKGEKCAFVTSKDSTYGTSRVHQALIEFSDIHTRVFRDLDQALEWLEVALLPTDAALQLD